MADYSGEKELLGTGVAAEQMRRTAGAMPPDAVGAKVAAKEYREAAEIRQAAVKDIAPENLPPAIGAPPVPAETLDGSIVAAPSGLGIGKDREHGMPLESEIPPNLVEAESRPTPATVVPAPGKASNDPDPTTPAPAPGAAPAASAGDAPAAEAAPARRSK